MDGRVLVRVGRPRRRCPHVALVPDVDLLAGLQFPRQPFLRAAGVLPGPQLARIRLADGVRLQVQPDTEPPVVLCGDHRAGRDGVYRPRPAVPELDGVRIGGDERLARPNHHDLDALRERGVVAPCRGVVQPQLAGQTQCRAERPVTGSHRPPITHGARDRIRLDGQVARSVGRQCLTNAHVRLGVFLNRHVTQNRRSGW